jgi:hypothetical protein
MFSRYSGEQVQQIPAGYAEGMGAMGRAYQSIGQSIGQGFMTKAANVKADKSAGQKATELGLLERKADAADMANTLKERGLANEALMKAYASMNESEKDIYGRVKDAVTAQGGIVVDLKAVRDSTDPAVTQEMKDKARLELKNAEADHVALTKKMVGMATKAPMTFDEYQAKQEAAWLKSRTATQKAKPVAPVKPAGAPKVDDGSTYFDEDYVPEEPAGKVKTSFYQSPAYNPNSTTGLEPEVTKTVAVGGSTKKVEVVGGRVSSVVSPNGEKTVLSNNLPESSVDAAIEFAGKLFPSPVSVKAFTGSAAPATAEEAVDLPGPLKSTYRQSAPLEPGLDSRSKQPVNGSIEFDTETDSTGKTISVPRVKFDSNFLINADKTDNEEGHRRLRELTLIHRVLMDGSYNDIEIDSDERDAALQDLGTANNGFNMPAIAKAHALVQRNLKRTQGYDNDADRFGIRFQDQYRLSPSEFMATGETANMRLITPSAEVALEETIGARVAKRLEEVGQQPGKPEGLDEAVKKNSDDVKFVEARLKEITKSLSDRMVIGTPQEKAFKNKQSALMHQLEIVKTEGVAIQNKINGWEAANRQYQQRSDAVSKEIDIDLKMQQLAEGRVKRADLIADKQERWIGINPDDHEVANGFVAKALKSLPLDQRKIPIRINGKPTGKFYLDTLDPVELFALMKKNKDAEGIADLSAMMPTKEMIHDPKNGIIVTQKKYIEGIKPINELMKLNDYYVGLKASGKLTGELKLNWEKLWHDNTGTSTGTTFQKTLVGKIREAIVGPGNPSNYEQEVIASIVPNPADFLTRPLRQRARIQALATLALFDHYNTMSANRLDISNEAMRNYTHQLGQVLGHKVTQEMFSGLFNDYVKSRSYWSAQQKIGNTGSSEGKDYAERLLDSLEQRAISAEAAKSK